MAFDIFTISTVSMTYQHVQTSHTETVPRRLTRAKAVWGSSNGAFNAAPTEDEATNFFFSCCLAKARISLADFIWQNARHFNGRGR
jgi:hypothetical protein